MDNEKTVDVLNTLIEINNDRIEGYETATKETQEDDLKKLFASMIATSTQCLDELTEEVERLGGTPTEGTKITGKFFRVWMDVKVALTSNERKAILNSCEYGEDVAVDTYEKVLENDNENLGIEQKTMVAAQHKLIKADHDGIKELRDQLVEQD